ncbi:sigma-54-dependent Fis family transcriptional regulator [Desulfitobacterium hafniense]|uniref:sigma-54-dependent Fis family transcriptional regulator n=1 Tax=Desulfitobacterium hafniense TaxID=49338 RepID=UPI00036353A9|nr:sigma-54-dependent Fis family transcriptional regulator [Desulfitobacterium hafniense]
MHYQSTVENVNPYIGPTADIDISGRWRGIMQSKRDFLEKGTNPRLSPYVRDEIANSWIRSQSYNLTPESMGTAPTISPHELNSIFEQNKELIDIAFPLLDSFKPLLTESGYMVSLVDGNGIVLYRNGNTKMVDRYGNTIDPGVIWNEATIGTCAHVLSIRHKKPISLLGPENFPAYFQNDITSTAPLFDSDGKVIAVLILLQKLGDDPWDLDLHNLQYLTLGWVTSLAMEIKTQLNLKLSNSLFKSTNTALQTAIKMMTEGMVIVSREGLIQHINSPAAQIFNCNTNEAIGRNIMEFLVKNDALAEALRQLKMIHNIEVEVLNDYGTQGYTFSIQPLPADSSGSSGGVVKIVDTEKAKNMVSSSSGAKLDFDFQSIKGASTKMLRTKSLAQRFARSPANILLIGESGTGKELFAQAIHNEYRPSGPFIVLNCAAIPKNLIESELFGYDSGAFTGAKKNGSPGKIELAEGGTLFLDEIGDMPIEIQAVLLRVLENKQVMRIGGSKYRAVDFRMVAATNKDLATLVQSGQFRQDLYYRLSVLRVDIPPLRQRDSDVLSLAEFFIQKYNWRSKLPKLSHETKIKLMEYTWPGNVRQLENAIIYALNVSEDELILPEHLPDEIIHNKNHPSSLSLNPIELSKENNLNEAELRDVVSLKEAEKIVVQNALAKSGNNICIAAELLGLSKSTLYRKLKLLGIDE